jgi:hypothetical protein
MPKLNGYDELKGLIFGRLTVLEFAGRGKDRGALWKVRCACGVEKTVPAHPMKNGSTKTCGGCTRELHGKSTTLAYRAWGGIVQRCENPKNPAFARYGGRGISVCRKWAESFAAFLEDMGPRPPGTSIDRIDNEGNYEPGNCRWATRTEQNRNTSRNVRLGEELQVDVARKLGVTHTAIVQRRKRGWDAFRAATQPARRCGTRGRARS